MNFGQNTGDRPNPEITDRTPADDHATGRRITQELTEAGIGSIPAALADYDDDELGHAVDYLQARGSNRTSEEEAVLGALADYFTPEGGYEDEGEGWDY